MRSVASNVGHRPTEPHGELSSARLVSTEGIGATVNAVVDNSAAQRYEMDVDGKSAFITYRRSSGVVTLLHAEVPPELSRHGIGSELANGALELARTQGLKVVPRCSFIANYIRKHTEFQDLLAEPR